MDMYIGPAAVAGQLKIPPSKSAAHRALIAAALSGGGRVQGILPSEDMHATCRALSALGVDCRVEAGTATLTRRSVPCTPVTVDCGESGSTVRFMIPIFAALGITATFVGRGRLPERPLSVYTDLLPQHGVSVQGDHLPLTVSGRLQSGEYTLPGNVSSQFITGLLFALPLCEGDSRIRLTSPLESAGYIDMTLRTLRAAGIAVTATPDGWDIPGGQTYRVQDMQVEGDWSQAAFPLVAAAIGGSVTLTGLCPDSAQGDRRIVEVLRAFGADITAQGGTIICCKAPLHGITVDASQVPDLVPAIAVCAAFAEGETHIVNAGRCRIKECDRLHACADGLSRVGVTVSEEPDSLHITGGGFAGGAVSGYNDHRIVMAFACGACASVEGVTVSDAEAVRKSWPAFFEDFCAIGGKSRVIEHR